MRRLIFTDVHANEIALAAVLNDAGHWDEALFLGDIVGFGPHPAECARLLQAGCTIEENGILTHHRVPYDIEKVVFDLDKIGLDPTFLSRWSQFVMTAHDPEWSRL